MRWGQQNASASLTTANLFLEAHKLEQGLGKGIWGSIVCPCTEGTGTNEEDDDEEK
jgi:hypothetical protein